MQIMKPRELSDDECIALLSSARYGRLGLSREDQPYVVPMSFVYHEGRIYLHSRGMGRKVKYAAENPRICFQVDHLEKGKWTSVNAFGRAELSDDIEAKQRMFDAFTKKGLVGHGGKSFQRQDLERMDMTIWEIVIDELTGREGVW
jgi:hypothetical protein